MELNEVSGEIVDAAVEIHSELGPGLLESVYEVVIAQELTSRGLRVERQIPITIEYRGLVFEEGYRIDLLVDSRLIVEIKSVETVTDVHRKQLLTYLRLQKSSLAYSSTSTSIS